MDWKKPRGYRKEDMLYPDRCMLKWQGMLLSDHTERMFEDRAAESVQKEAVTFSEQELEQWDALLQKSMMENCQLRFRINRVNELPYFVIGRVQCIKGRNIHILEGKSPSLIQGFEVDEITEYHEAE